MTHGPSLMSHLEPYSPEQARWCPQVRPELTGLAQISSRYVLSWGGQFRLDVHYVDHPTFLGELKVIRVTLVSVEKRDGVPVAGEATMVSRGNDNRKETA
jgi:lipopolysaccharide/colanic/teichoic acid biosynthesis glycosyltransferase